MRRRRSSPSATGDLGAEERIAARYAALGLPFPLAGTPAPDTELLHRVQRQFQDHGIDAYL